MTVITIITQARFASTRLPGKVLKDVNGTHLLEIHLQRLKTSKLASQVIVATTHEKEAIDIVRIAESNGCIAYQGEMDDVLDRYYHAARAVNSDIIVRVTSDCPLNEGVEVDNIIKVFLANNVDYVSNIRPPTYPDGIDIEVFSFSALEKAWKEASKKKHREHVTPYIVEHPEIFARINVTDAENNSSIRLTVDKQEDLELIRILVKELGYKKPWREYMTYLKEHPEIGLINQQFIRNEGY
jgi:spore coat polysaccharide biosynthesis protein SpsF